MGLSMSHNAWDSPYSQFNDYRKMLANLLGFHLTDMEGFDGSISWDKLAHDDLFILLNHSNCDGHIPPADCALLAARLTALLPRIPDYRNAEYKDLWRNKTERLIGGLLRAHAANEPLEFN